MALLNAFTELLKPASFKEEITDAKQIAADYKYWRLRIFYSMYMGYVFFYFSRKSFTFAMPALMEDLQLNYKDLGILSSILYITYGISKFTSGTLSDKCNPRYFMAFGLMITGFLNIFFGLADSIFWFSIFWGLNGWFQGWGWGPVTKQLTHWYGRNERGTWWSVCSSSHNVGGYLIAIIGAYIAQEYGWRNAMHLPGIICIIGSLFLFERLRDTPQSLGLPPIEKFKKENFYSQAYQKNIKEPESLTIKQILLEHVLNNKYVWALAISYFFIYVVRTAVNDWTGLFLKENKGYSVEAAGLTVAWFELGGFLGTIFAGWGSDKLFKGKRVPYMVVCALVLLIAIPSLWLTPIRSMVIDSFLIALIGFFVFGPQMLAGLAAAELVNKKAAGTSNGFAGLFGYFGAAVSGYPLGAVIYTWGWYKYFYVLGFCSVMVLVILLPMWSVGEVRQIKHQL